MRKSVVAIISGLVLAFATAAFLGLVLRMPLTEWRISESPLLYIARALLPISAFAMPLAFAAIALSEARRVRGLPYWLFIGAVIGLLGCAVLSGGPPETRAAFQNMKAFFSLASMGLAGGFVYWWAAGRHAGRLARALIDASSGRLDESGSRRRCWRCAIAGLALSLMPLALLGWYTIYRPTPMLPQAIIAKTEADASTLLSKGGVPALAFKVTDHIGHVTGTSMDEGQRIKDFETAKAVLAPMVGVPGIVAYLQNDIAIKDQGGMPPGTAPAQKLIVADSKEAAKRQEDAGNAAKLAAQRAAEAALAAKAAEEAGQAAAAAAKRKTDEIQQANAKAAADKAEAELQAARDAEAKKKAVAQAKADAERKAADEEKQRIAQERATFDAVTAAKRKAEAEARAAAEKVAEEKATAERLAADAEARRKAEEKEARLMAERAAKDRALEEARLAAEAEAERKAVAAAHAAETAAIAKADAEAKALAAAAAKPNTATCAVEFSDLLRSDTIRFGLRSAELSAGAKAYIDQIAALAKQCPGYSLSIGGHSSRTGVAAYNAAISKARANAVRDALLARGIDAGRMQAEGYGAERPFDPANNRRAYALNRRVDLGAAPAVDRPMKSAVAPEIAAAAGQSPATPAVRDNGGSPPAKADIASAACAGEFSRLFLSETVRFNGSSARVAPIYASFLDRLAGLMSSCSKYRLTIGGHTDRRGKDAVNQRLSEARAQRVLRALVARGVPAQRIKAEGYAGQRPFDPGNSAKAFALNRRVDFGVSELAN